MKSIIYMDKRGRAADGVCFLCAENRMQVIDSTCNHPSGSCRWVESLSNSVTCFILSELMPGWKLTGTGQLGRAQAPHASRLLCES